MRFRLSFGLLSTFLVLPALGQTVREPVFLGPSTSPRVLETSGDHSIAFWKFGVTDSILRMSTSDGRGLEWSDEVEFDNQFKSSDSIAVDMIGPRVYALWSRFVSGGEDIEVYTARSLDGGLNWTDPLPIPFNFESGNLVRRVLDLEVEAGAGPDFLAGLVRNGESGLLVVRSLDGGQNFEATTTISDEFFPEAQIRVDGGFVHVVYKERLPEEGITRLVYRTSHDQGLTFEPPFVVLENTFGIEHIDLVVEGDRVVLATTETNLGVHAYASSDGGLSFAPATSLPVVEPSPIPVDLVRSQGETFLVYGDEATAIPGTAETVYVARSLDDGQSWEQPIPVFGTGGSKACGLVVAGPSVVAWVQTSPASFVGEPIVSVWDGETESFAEPVVAVDDNAQSPMFAGNDLYGNVLLHYETPNTQSGKPNKLDAGIGGFRPQSLRFEPASQGSLGSSFEFTFFPEEETLAWVLISRDPGDLILNDGRNLGLQPTAFLTTSISLASSGLFAAPLMDGSGTTPPLPFGIPVGIGLWAVGLGFDLSTGALGSLTDAFPIDL